MHTYVHRWHLNMVVAYTVTIIHVYTHQLELVASLKGGEDPSVLPECQQGLHIGRKVLRQHLLRAVMVRANNVAIALVVRVAVGYLQPLSDLHEHFHTLQYVVVD